MQTASFMCNHDLASIRGEVIGVSAPLARSSPESPTHPFPADSDGTPNDLRDLSGQILGDRYLLLRRIGKRVALYQARRTSLGSPLMIRVILGADDDAASQTFLAHAEAAARLHHGHIVRIMDFGVDTLADGTRAAYLVMEPLRGENLANTLAKCGPLPWPRVLTIAKQLCRALIAAHDRGVVHGGINAANCLRLVRPGTPDFIKLLDFGVTHRPATPATCADDLQAIGVLMYRLLTNKMPGPTPSLRGAVSPLTSSPSFAALVLDTITPAPDHKTHARLFYRSLVAVESVIPVAALAAGPGAPAAPVIVVGPAIPPADEAPASPAPDTLPQREASPGPIESPWEAFLRQHRLHVAQRAQQSAPAESSADEWRPTWLDLALWSPLVATAMLAIHAALETR